ncbi:YczE/YyaS/YitT family protein [Bacillus amyloliquefaciens]|uniref:YczE/YyaS/YitT family protein n=1 Tax=Bacillus amyloliquefaciens TaxID=1390 RepID=UPI0015811CDC|nr:YitT family protein [Bacillus amyloliquefaciens]NUI30305.1 YitT family protein [Bacillus amyloliquefaciens]NUI34023.1 YitT family protein [Bacillus amyloliquefaciens]NUI67858.1 YitT family protein [Bacillus amyloliquefaciens]NUI71579.1 YitT family protein [Bacillus amyloliquefaciens]
MKYVFYVLGIMILTFGISVTIQSDLGTSPFDALIVGLSVHAGLTVGSWEIIIAFLLICCNSMLKRQRPEFSGMITAFITGIGIDMWLFFLHRVITPELWYGKAGCFAIGLVVIGIGAATYLHTNFAPIPVDRLTLIVRELTGRSIFFSRTVIYFIFFILAVMLKGPVGIGTLLTVCLGGVILHFFMPITGRWIDGILTASPKQEETKTR